MDGLAFVKQIQESYTDAIKILITAYGSDEIASKATNLGVEGFVEKPFTSKAIEEFLSRLIQKRHKGEKRKEVD